MTISAFSIIASATGVTLAILLDKIYKNIKIVVSLCLLYLTIIILILKFYDFESEYSKMSEKKLLNQAQKKFDIEKYNEALGIYIMPDLDINSIAQNNLAYMYEKGIYVHKDIYQARKLYKNAATLGGKFEMENYIAFSLNYPISQKEVMEILKKGYKNQSKNVSWFLTCIMQNKECEENEADSVYAKQFWELSEEEQNKLLFDYMEIEYMDFREFENEVGEDFFSVYEAQKRKRVSTGYEVWKNPDGTEHIEELSTYVDSFTYEIEVKKLRYANLLETKFIKIE